MDILKFNEYKKEGLLKPELSDFINDNIFKLKPSFLHAIELAVSPALSLVDKGYAEIKPLTTKGENIIIKELRTNIFPNPPKVVDDKFFNSLTKKFKVYYRGVRSSKFIDDLLYNRKAFTGSSNIVQGTWISSNKDYASNYHHDKKEPLNILLKPSTKLISGNDTSNIMFRYKELIHRFEKEILKNDNFDKLLYHQTRYFYENFLSNDTIIALINGYDGIIESEDIYNEVIVILNKEKMIVKKPI